MNHNFNIHETRVRFLETLAELIGCTLGIGATIADGSRPDVFRTNIGLPALFVGEAKNTERPTCAATQYRMRNYFKWLSAFQHRACGTGIFAICFGNELESSGWIETVNRLADEEHLSWKSVGQMQCGQGFCVVWFLT